MGRLADKLKSVRYPQLIASGYVALILIGALLLSLPAASRSGEGCGFITALFTATSATCVTGLVLVDTYTHWSLFGQSVIITLIQIGGLGFMTVITMVSLMLGKHIGLRARDLLRDSINTMYVGGVVRMFKRILIGTAIFELSGAALLAFRFVPLMGWGEGLFAALFHSVSAFCNAGFDLMGRYGEFSSLTSFSADPLVVLTVSALIIIGGIGFFVWDDVVLHKFEVRKYKLHTKITLASTGVLLVLGFALFMALERRATMAGMSAGERVLASLFCSVTPRTAGFNTVDIAAMSPASRLLTMLLMFIGGSPGSTAGGIKTTTVAVLFIATVSSLRRLKGDNAFKRRLEENAVRRATAVVMVNLVIAVLAVLVICALQPELGIESVLFEAFSAIATVGLTGGATAQSCTASQLILALLMFAGRVGSVTLMLMFAEPRRAAATQMPEERINIG